MAELSWDQTGERIFETGVDRGVLYMPDSSGAYVDGVAWNGLVTVTESPSGAEANPQYADNIKYLNLFSAEEFNATVEAYTYPDEFAQYDGLATPQAGVTVGQQSRPVFGLSYRSRVGNDVQGDDLGYKLHLIYGCQASPSEKAYTTVNDSPEAITFSWEVTTTPVGVTGHRPTSIITIDSTKVDSTALATLEDLLWGTPGTDPSLPLPDQVLAIFAGTVVEATATEPAFDDVDEITIPSITGVDYVDLADPGTVLASGTYTITEDTFIQARAQTGYVLAAGDTDWFYTFGG